MSDLEHHDNRAYEPIMAEGREAGAYLLAHPGETPPPEITTCCQNAQQFLKGLLLEDPQMAKAIRAELIRIKREYDETGDSYKTPFALNLEDMPEEGSFERQLLFLACLNDMGTVHGCSGGCKQCGVDAFPVKSRDIEPIPWGQKKHFIDELASCLDKVPAEYRKFIDKFYWYADSDPMNEPDVDKLLAYFYKCTGISTISFLSSLPRGSQDRFLGLITALKSARKVRDIKILLSAYESYDYNSLSHVSHRLVYEVRAIARIWAQTGSIPDKTLAELEETLREEEVTAAGIPPNLSVGISGVPRNHSNIYNLDKACLSDQYTVVHKRGPLARTQSAFVDLGTTLAKKVREGHVIDDPTLKGIDSGSCMQIKPFGLNNVVWGNVSKDYYQGRVSVPFEGLTQETPLARAGQPLSRLLRHTLVLKSLLYSEYIHEVRRKVVIFDKDERFRAITFDPHTYRVIDEEVLFTREDLEEDNPWEDLLKRLQSWHKENS